ncbi:putative reverse transcriptase domain-containing protein [Tanacetum coccineum]
MAVNHWLTTARLSVNHQQLMVANGGQQWRSTTVNDGGPPLTTVGPPPGNRSTVVDRQSTGGSWVSTHHKARGKAYVRGGGDANPDSNVVKGTFLLNNHYDSMIFDSGTDRSFVWTTFSTLLDVTPDTLDVSYVVELADRRIFETNTVLRGCTLGLLGHPFNIGLMPVELGSFDVIIGMDRLADHHAVIVCDEKIVRIPYGDEVLIVQGDCGISYIITRGRFLDLASF